jgi:predicted SnoaL-like aldol condensation-catalyzing enzyme
MELTLQPASEEMRKAAESFFRLLYVDHDFVGAMRSHASPNFTEHNSELPNSPEEQIKWFSDRSAADPEHFAPESEWKTRFVHKLIVANYLIVHYFMSVSPNDRGRMFADFWRFDGNKIVEHWDVLQPVPEKTKSGNTMW